MPCLLNGQEIFFEEEQTNEQGKKIYTETIDGIIRHIVKYDHGDLGLRNSGK